MGSGFAETYTPNPARVADYQPATSSTRPLASLWKLRRWGEKEPVAV